MDLVAAGLAGVGGLGVGVVAGSIYTRRRARRKEDLEIKTIRADHGRALATVAGGLAHELRTPLSTMEINLQLLEEEWRNPVSDREKRSHRRLESVARGAQRIQEILQVFSSLFQNKPLRFEPTDLNELLESLIQGDLGEMIASRNLVGRIQLTYDFAPGLPLVRIDRITFRQAMLNLLRNAVEALPEGGGIGIRTFSDAQRVGVSISDNGSGIPAENLGRIWEPYFTTKPSGMGMGLTVAKRFTEVNGGTVDVASTPGKGATFTLHFPRHNA